MRTTYVMRNGELVPKDEAPPRHGGGSAFMVIGDSMDAVRHPRTGKVYDSKSAFRAESRRHGLIEVGNEFNAITRREPQRLPSSAPDVAMAYRKVMGG